MNTLEALTVGTTGALSVYVYYHYRWQKYQHALQWFYARQANRWAEQAETVREQLFQRAFALRRAIELSAFSADEQTNENLSRCVDLSQDFNIALETVSNNLAEPFLEESLPLALQSFLQSWSEAYGKQVVLTLDLPSDWQWRQTVKHRLLLWCLGECLKLCQPSLSPTSPQALRIILSQDKNVAQLRLAFNGQLLQNAYVSDELNYIRQVFQLLMPGRCKLKCSDSQLVGELSWSVAPQDK